MVQAERRQVGEQGDDFGGRVLQPTDLRREAPQLQHQRRLDGVIGVAPKPGALGVRGAEGGDQHPRHQLAIQGPRAVQMRGEGPGGGQDIGGFLVGGVAGRGEQGQKRVHVGGVPITRRGGLLPPDPTGSPDGPRPPPLFVGRGREPFEPDRSAAGPHGGVAGTSPQKGSVETSRLDRRGKLCPPVWITSSVTCRFMAGIGRRIEHFPASRISTYMAVKEGYVTAISARSFTLSPRPRSYSRDDWAQVSDLGRLGPVERSVLWERQFLKPHAYDNYAPA